MDIAVIGLQGAVEEHINALKEALKKLRMRGQVIWARNRNDLKGIAGIVLPGGESTTIGKLAMQNKLHSEIIKMAKKGIPILATCAGTILLAKKVFNDEKNGNVRLLKILDIEVKRNAYGRQKDSFEAEINVKGIGKFNGIFIRAPTICKINDKKIETFATLGKQIVGVEKDNILALTFHPELSGDLRIHKYFLQKCKKLSKH